MKISCSVCMMQEAVDSGTMDEVSEMVNRHGLRAISYIKFLNMIRGKCLNGDEHSFQFEEEYLKEVTSVVDKHKKAQIEIQKLIEENGSIGKELNEHEAKIKELKAKSEANEDRINGLEKDVEDCRYNVKNLTGAEDISIWY